MRDSAQVYSRTTSFAFLSVRRATNFECRKWAARRPLIQAHLLIHEVLGR